MVEFTKIDKDTVDSWHEDENAWEDQPTREQLIKWYEAEVNKIESNIVIMGGREPKRKARLLGEYTEGERLKFMREELARLKEEGSPLLRMLPLSVPTANALHRFGVRTVGGLQAVIEAGKKPGDIGVRHWQEITDGFENYGTVQNISGKPT